MLRCTQCGSEETFEVDELAHQRILVQALDNDDYAWKETLATYEVTWGMVQCCTCQHQMEEQDARDAYALAREDEDAPITYTLVDASIT